METNVNTEREREGVHFAALFSLHSGYLWDRGWWYAQNNGRGGRQPQEQVKAWREKALGEEERRQGNIYREIFSLQLLSDRLKFSLSSVSSSRPLPNF